MIDIVLPEDTKEGTQTFLSKWLKNIGDTVALHEPIAEVSTDKVIVEISSPAEGVISELTVAENDEIQPGQVLGKVSPASLSGTRINKSDTGGIAQESQKVSKLSTPVSSDASREMSPAVRKIVKERNIDISQIRGSGRDGRITVDDVENYLKAAPTGTRSGASPTTASKGRVVALTPMRKTIARNLSDSLLRVAPHVTTVFDVDFSSVLAHKESAKTKLTLTAYILKAICDGVKVVPEINSQLHDSEIEIFDDVNIGVGVATDDGGLIVPVIKEAQNKSIAQLSDILSELTNRARKGDLKRDEISGATVSLSNYGMTGGLFATPIIIPQPQSAIIGVGTLEKRAKVLEDGSIVARPMSYITLTLDHRVLDGFAANRFMSEMKRSLQSGSW